MKRSILRLLIILSLALATTDFAQSEEKTRVGVSVPLRGGAAAYGSDILNGLKFANSTFLNDRYDLVVEDDNCAPKEAVSVAKKFVSITNLKYVLGFACSGCVLASAPVYEKGRVIAITSGATAPAISNAGEYIFRTYPNSDSGASLLSEYIAKNHKKVGVISEETDYAQAVLSGILKGNIGGKVEYVTKSYLPAESDFRTIIERLRADKVEGIVLNPQSEDRLILMVKQIRESGFKPQLYGFIYPSSPAFLKSVGAAAEGVIFPDTPSMPEVLGEEGKRLQAKFIEEFGHPKSSDFYVLSSILAFQALDQSIRSGKDAMEALSSQEFDGVVGKFRFDKQGDIEKFGYVMKVIKNGRAARLDEAG